MTTITFDTTENLADTLYRFAQTKQKSLNETLNEIEQAYFEKSAQASKFAAPPRRRKRYSLTELLDGATHEIMSEINAETSWARDGEAVGRELI